MSGARMFFRDTSDEAAPRVTLHDLPVELLAETMSYLPFADKVNVSHTDARLRKVALGRSDLWEDIRVAIRLSSVNTVNELMARARPDRPLSVVVLDVAPDDLNPLSHFIASYLGRIRTLSLRFAEVDLDEDDMENYRWGLCALWQSFAFQPANQLECLELFGGREPVYQIPYSIFNAVAPPLLRLLYVRGFEFEEACPAFASVERVETTLASLSRFKSIGELFPAATVVNVREMESFTIPDIDDDGQDFQRVYATMRDIPRLDGNHRVKNLLLSWQHPVRGPIDCEAVEWLAGSARFVDRLVVESPEVVDVPRAALRYTGYEFPSVLLVGRQMLTLICLDPAMPITGRAAQEGKTFRSGSVVIPSSNSEVYANSLIVQMDRLAPRMRQLKVVSTRIAVLIIMPQSLSELWQVVIDIEPESIDSNGGLVLPAPAASFPALRSIRGLHLTSTKAAVTLDARSVLQVAQIFPNLKGITVNATSVTLFQVQAIEAFLLKPAV